MNTDLLIAAISNIFIGTICIGISLPLLRGKIRRNLWYGVRIPKSYASEDNWHKINQYGARAMILWSLPVVVIGFGLLVAAFMVPKTHSGNVGWIVAFSLTGLIILGALVQTLLWSKALPNK